MSEAPYINFYTSDFLGGTSGMTAATKGVYITLLCLMYEAEGPLTQSWDTLARRCGCTVPAFRKALQSLEDDGKLTLSDDGIWSEKCDKHIASRRERRNSAKAAAEKRWQKTQEKQCEADATAANPHCQPEPEPENTLEANASNAAASDGFPEPIDARKEAVWKRGVPFLVERGVPEGQARSCIGKWIRDYGSAALFDALAAAAQSGTHDPIPYITRALEPEPLPDVAAMVRAATEALTRAK